MQLTVGQSEKKKKNSASCRGNRLVCKVFNTTHLLQCLKNCVIFIDLAINYKQRENLIYVHMSLGDMNLLVFSFSHTMVQLYNGQRTVRLWA